MDTHDVSDSPQFVQMLRKQKQSLQDAQSLKGQRFVAKKSRGEITMQFRLRLMLQQGKPPVNKSQLRTTFVPPAYPPCARPLGELKKVMIKNLFLETHHRGSYLLLRAITPADRMSAIMAIAEDENSDVLMLQLYNRESEKERNTAEIISEGLVHIVKEPYLKLMSDGEYGIRVDHPSDLVPLSAHDTRIPSHWRQGARDKNSTAGGWKTKGNDNVAAAKYHVAIECSYTQGIDCSPTEDETHSLRLNRSLAYLKTKQFDAALSDLEHVPATAEKALYRKAQALYDLRRYPESCEVLKALCLKYPENSAARTQLTRAVNRRMEQDRGRFQFRQLYKEAAELRPPHLDHSTYVGPVSVRPSGSRGRGLFTTKAVKAGDLLLCEKAFAHAFVDTQNAQDNHGLTVLINTGTDRITMGAQAELINMVVQKLYRNPSLSSIVTDLHHGAYKPVTSEVNGLPLVDTFLIERIVALNCFGCPLSSREDHLRATKVDTNPKPDNKHHHSCGIWPMASYINHSCYSNARRAFIGDMMVIRATQDLPPDTELTFWYNIPAADDDNGRSKKFQHWGFECDCSICQDDQATDQRTFAKRATLRADGMAALRSNGRTVTRKIETIATKLADTYSRPATEVPRLSIMDIQLALAHIYMRQLQLAKAVDAALGALTCLGYVIEGGNLPRSMGKPMVVRRWGLLKDHVIDCWMLLSAAYRSVAPDLEAQAVEYARISYKVCIGEDETFKETFGE
ncbi:hypothetical protein AK830_g4617 [Neonectria ditissima]|uniref:SET domain-containing protein n=1 Tax=Neonectria ditissima TaxID=78410 RepID=A0A0P7BMN8_9HYPO|nr:hypothetical protein AK830_g4617 [Neonectria ditissima]